MPSRREVLATVGVGSFSLLAGCIGGDYPIHGDWPRPGYDNRNSGYAPQHHGPKSNPVVKWSADVPEGYNASSPVLVDDSVYIGYGTEEQQTTPAKVGLRVLDIETGERTDDFTVATHPGSSYQNGTIYRDSVVHANGNLYVQAFDGLHSLTTAGKKRWHVPMHGGPTNSSLRRAHPVVADGLVYAPTASATADTDGPKSKEALYAVDESSGDVVWKYVPRAEAQGWTFPPAYADGVVYLSALDYGVVALDAKSGDVLWRTRLPAYGPPAVSGGRVYVSLEPDESIAYVVALNAKTGAERWRTADGGTRLGRRLAVADGRMYYSQNLRDLVSLDAKTGDERWRYSDASQVYLGTPAVTDDALFAGVVKNRTDRGIVVLDPKNGEEMAFRGIGTDTGVKSSIALSDSLAVVTSEMDTVYAFESCEFDLAGHCLS